MGFRIEKVIRDEKPVTTDEDRPVEIVQAEETREVKSTPPERVRDPIVQVIIVPGWRIISNHWRALIRVVIIYYCWVELSLIFSILSGAAGHDSQAELRGNTLECFQGIVLFHWQFVGVSCGYHGIL